MTAPHAGPGVDSSSTPLPVKRGWGVTRCRMRRKRARGQLGVCVMPNGRFLDPLNPSYAVQEVRMAAKRTKTPVAPKSLRTAGQRLWRSTLADLADSWELTARELRYLELACGQADHVAELERLIDEEGMVTIGSTGQPVLNAAVSECRNGRLAIHRLLGAIELPVEDEPRSESVKSTRGRHAAQARWRKEADLDARRKSARRQGRGKA